MGGHISQKWYEFTTGDQEIDRYLSKVVLNISFVKSLKGNDAGSLLQFLTGSNIIICGTITVTFTNVELVVLSSSLVWPR